LDSGAVSLDDVGDDGRVVLIARSLSASSDTLTRLTEVILNDVRDLGRKRNDKDEKEEKGFDE
jgi:hypothetical protein